jgi:hypothetical protein
MQEAFNPNSYGSTIQQFLRENRIFDLGPGTPNESIRASLNGLSINNMLQHDKASDDNMIRVCIACIWIYHDYLEESHSIVQTIPSTTSSYLHGIMHRREPDYSNAKYWFSKVPTHPIFIPLYRMAHDLSLKVKDAPEIFTDPKGIWDASAFADLCQENYGKKNPTEKLCRQIQRFEWELLFDYSYNKAINKIK